MLIVQFNSVNLKNHLVKLDGLLNLQRAIVISSHAREVLIELDNFSIFCGTVLIYRTT